MKKDTDRVYRYTEEGMCAYRLNVVPEHGKRTVNVVVTGGELKGRSALVIKMPDEFSGFFPELDRGLNHDVKRSFPEKIGITKGSSGRL